MEKLTELGKILVTLKIDNNETVTEQAHNLGVQTSYISAIIHGRVGISFKVGQKIFNKYKLSETQTKTLLKEVFNQNVVEACESFKFDVRKFAIALFKEA